MAGTWGASFGRSARMVTSTLPTRSRAPRASARPRSAARRCRRRASAGRCRESAGRCRPPPARRAARRSTACSTDVAVRMAEQAALERDLDAAQPQRPARRPADGCPSPVRLAPRAPPPRAPRLRTAGRRGSVGASAGPPAPARRRAARRPPAGPTIRPSPSDSERSTPELCVPVERAR